MNMGVLVFFSIAGVWTQGFKLSGQTLTIWATPLAMGGLLII
jgi:hypothetical protein